MWIGDISIGSIALTGERQTIDAKMYPIQNNAITAVFSGCLLMLNIES